MERRQLHALNNINLEIWTDSIVPLLSGYKIHERTDSYAFYNSMASLAKIQRRTEIPVFNFSRYCFSVKPELYPHAEFSAAIDKAPSLPLKTSLEVIQVLFGSVIERAETETRRLETLVAEARATHDEVIFTAGYRRKRRPLK